MNKFVLLWTHDNLHAWVGKAERETVPEKRLLRILMLSMADMCADIGFESLDTMEAFKERTLSQRL